MIIGLTHLANNKIKSAFLRICCEIASIRPLFVLVFFAGKPSSFPCLVGPANTAILSPLPFGGCISLMHFPWRRRALDASSYASGAIAIVDCDDLAVVPPGRREAGTLGAFAQATVRPAVQSATWPPDSMKAIGRHALSVSAWILVVRPPRDRPMA